MLSDKVRGERELRERYGYYLLGSIPKEGKKRPFDGIDRLLKGVEGAEGIETDEAYRIVATNIANLA